MRVKATMEREKRRRGRPAARAPLAEWGSPRHVLADPGASRARIQAAWLRDAPLHRAQRQSAALRTGRTRGNQYLQRAVHPAGGKADGHSRSDRRRGAVQRAPDKAPSVRPMGGILYMALEAMLKRYQQQLQEELEDYRDHAQALKYILRANGAVFSEIRMAAILETIDRAKKVIKRIVPKPYRPLVDLVDPTKALKYGAKILRGLTPILGRYRKMAALAMAMDNPSVFDIVAHKKPKQILSTMRALSRRVSKLMAKIAKQLRAMKKLSQMFYARQRARREAGGS